MRVQVLLLMAGLGSRFRSGGYGPSKPLIPVDGVPMFEHALSGLDGIDTDLTVVVRSEQIVAERIDEAVLARRASATVVEIPAPTRGAAESALAATPRLDPARPLVVLDCDLSFASSAYVALIHDVCAGTSRFDAGLLTFSASDPRYSFARVADNGRVVEVAEKRVISERAIAGAYLFGSAGVFASTARAVVDGGLDDRLPEFYLSAVVQALLRDGRTVVAAQVDQYESFGTPDELEDSLEARHAG